MVNTWGGIARFQYGNLKSFVNSEGVAFGIDSSGIVHVYRNSCDDTIDLYQYISTSLIPENCIIRNNSLFVPSRRFIAHDLLTGKESVQIVNDEPQAFTFDESGIYTANYTECTVYYYPWELFTRTSYTVDMNSSEYLLIDIDKQCRPFDLLITNDRKLLIASGSLYGYYGGALTLIDLENGSTIGSYLDIVNNQKVIDIAESTNEKRVWLGTSTYGENTIPAHVDAPPHIILWDVNEKIAIKDFCLDYEDLSVSNLNEYGDYLYALNHFGNMVIVDINSGEEVSRDDRSWRGLVNIYNNLYIYDDSQIYLLTYDGKSKLIIEGMKNLNCISFDATTKRIFGFEGERLVELTSFFAE